MPRQKLIKLTKLDRLAKNCSFTQNRVFTKMKLLSCFTLKGITTFDFVFLPLHNKLVSIFGWLVYQKKASTHSPGNFFLFRNAT